MSATFENALYEVKDKTGNEVTIQSEDGVRYRRNLAHVKNYECEEQASQESIDVEETLDNESNVSGESSIPVQGNRPRRERRAPKRFDDYLLYR